MTATAGLEVGTQRILHPGPLLWLRAIAWLARLFVVFNRIHADAGCFAAPMFKTGDRNGLGVAGLIADAGAARQATFDRNLV